MVGAAANSNLAYSLWRVRQGWGWSVYDMDGATIATGEAETQAEAERAISDVYHAPARSTDAA